MLETHQIVRYLVGTSDFEIPMDDMSFVVDKIAAQELFVIDVWMHENQNEESVKIKSGYRREAVGISTIRKVLVTSSGYLTDMQLLEGLKDYSEWKVWEVYEDGTIGGIEVKGGLGILAKGLKGFSASLVYPDDIVVGGDEAPTTRPIHITYSKPSEYNGTVIVDAEYRADDISPLRPVIINGGGSDFVGVNVFHNSGFQNDEMCKIGGLSEFFIYGDDTLATGIEEPIFGNYIGFDESKESVTLIDPTLQDGDYRWIANNSVLFGGSVFGEDLIAAVDDNYIALTTDY